MKTILKPTMLLAAALLAWNPVNASAANRSTGAVLKEDCDAPAGMKPGKTVIRLKAGTFVAFMKMQASKGGKLRIRAVVRKWKSHGDPRYLAHVMQCVEARNRLLGLTKHWLELSGPDKGPLQLDTTTEKDFDMEHIDAFLARHYAERVAKSQPTATDVPDANGAASARTE